MGELRSVAADGEGFVGLALLTLLGLERCPGLSYTPQGEPVVHLVESQSNALISAMVEVRIHPGMQP